MRIGVDLGGTKIEAIAIDKTGHELWRRRIATPAGNYLQILDAIHKRRKPKRSYHRGVALELVLQAQYRLAQV